jgi:hypothetical protein
MVIGEEGVEDDCLKERLMSRIQWSYVNPQIGTEGSGRYSSRLLLLLFFEAPTVSDWIEIGSGRVALVARPWL